MSPLRVLEKRLCEQGIGAGPESALTVKLGDQKHASIEATLEAALLVLAVPPDIRERARAIYRQDPAYEDMTFGQVLAKLGFHPPRRTEP